MNDDTIMAPLAALLQAPVIAPLLDAVIVFTVLEGLALAAFNSITGRGVAKSDFVANMASGLCLMLAMRCLVHGSGPAWIASFLLAAGLAHATDLRSRWKRKSERASHSTGVTA